MNEILWRTRDDSYREGRWQYILHDIGYSAGLYGDATTSAKTDHFRLALERYPLFAAAMENEEFRALFARALHQIGSVNLRPARVEALMEAWDRSWAPLRQDYILRYALPPENWEEGEAVTLAFFRQRYSIILRDFLSWYGPFLKTAAP